MAPLTRIRQHCGVRMRRASLGLAVVLLVALGAGPAGATTKHQLSAEALSLANMPSGWSVDPTSGAGATANGCLHTLKLTAKHDVKVLVQYHDGTAPVLGEVLEAGPGAAGRLRSMASTFAKCKTVTLTNSSTGQRVNGTMEAMSFPPVGTKSFAYAARFNVQGVTIGLSLVGFSDRGLAGAVLLEDIGQPDTTLLQVFVTAALDKIEGKPVTAPSN
jgi:hypothetical protein